MKKGILRNQKGITLLSLMLTIVILGILAGIAITNMDIGTDIRDYNYMCADIELLETKVRTYYNENKALPILTEGNILNPNLDGQESIKDDESKYYKIDISKLYNITLNYGGGTEANKDIYIINEQSHEIYYLKGVKYKGNIAHRKN